MENVSIFTQLSLVIVLAAIVSLVMRLMRQPLIMGYIVTGIIVGPAVLHMVDGAQTFDTFAQIGIALLLFIVGVGLNASVIKSLGSIASSTALISLVTVGGLGFLISRLFGFTDLAAIIIGLSLFFSSTIIILKTLSDKKETHRLYGQIAIGVLLIEDVIATLSLVVIAALGNGGGLTSQQLIDLAARACGLGFGLYLVARYLLPQLTKQFAASQELLYLFTIAWGFGIASIFYWAGFSLEVGALFAGVSMAGLPYSTEITARLKPLRDFFVILFFIFLGSSFSFAGISQNLGLAVILSATVIFAKPLFTMVALGIKGYTKLTSFKTAVHRSQISEFSIILVVFAVGQGLVDSNVATIVTLAALITIAISTYLMKYDDQLYRLWERQLSLFERRIVTEHTRKPTVYPLVLFGFQKGGYEFVKTFRELKQNYVVVDYDPEVVDTLESQGIHHIYGDATDIELLEEIGLDKAKMVVSVVTDYTVNEYLAKRIRSRNPHCVFVCHAADFDEAANLYGLGATHVILPHFIGSQAISGFIKKHGYSHSAFEKYKKDGVLKLGRQALRS